MRQQQQQVAAKETIPNLAEQNDKKAAIKFARVASIELL
jgi:hypothetical protein